MMRAVLRKETCCKCWEETPGHIAAESWRGLEKACRLALYGGLRSAQREMSVLLVFVPELI